MTIPFSCLEDSVFPVFLFPWRSCHRRIYSSGFQLSSAGHLPVIIPGFRWKGWISMRSVDIPAILPYLWNVSSWCRSLWFWFSQVVRRGSLSYENCILALFQVSGQWGEGVFQVENRQCVIFLSVAVVNEVVRFPMIYMSWNYTAVVCIGIFNSLLRLLLFKLFSELVRIELFFSSLWRCCESIFCGFEIFGCDIRLLAVLLHLRISSR